MRPTIIAGNWKMHKTIHEALEFINELPSLILDTDVVVYLATPFTSLSAVAERLCESTQIFTGAQNISSHDEGAWTGEISGKMVKEAGAEFVLLGHSERRLHFGETSAIVNQKVIRAFTADLLPIVCVGETLEERETGKAYEVIKQQMTESLAGLTEEEAKLLILAYEPVWAIGTGKNASTEEAQFMHKFCRSVLKELWNEAVAEKTPLLYGGSVKPENAYLLLSQPDIDGVLVGGASLNAHIFSQIVNTNVNNQVA